MTCQDMQPFLAMRRDLDAAHEQALQAHLQTCAGCRGAWAREEQTTRLLRSLPSSQAQLSAGARTAMRHRLARTRSGGRFAPALAFTALLALVAFLLPHGDAAATPDGTGAPATVAARPASQPPPTDRPPASSNPTAAASPAGISPVASAYLEHALALLQTHARNRDLVDWPALRTAVFANAGAAQTPADTYGALNYALGNLYESLDQLWTPAEGMQYQQGTTVWYGLRASYPDATVIEVYPGSPAATAGLRTGDQLVALNATPMAELPQAAWTPVVYEWAPLPAAGASPMAAAAVDLTVARAGASAPLHMRLQPAPYSFNRPPTARRLAAGVNYLELPSVGGPQAGARYAAAAHAAVRAVDAADSCGWIVDLRRNVGGNTFGMLAAAGPLLGDGEVGGSVVGSARTGWFYQDGQVRAGSEVMVAVPDAAPTIQPPPAVAVLTSRETANAGEAVAVAFRGRAQTRSFGEPTFGAPMVLQPFTLEDGALLLLTVGRMADRTGQTYDSRIAPDEDVAIDWAALDTERDPVLEAASAWLRDQPACRP